MIADILKLNNMIAIPNTREELKQLEKSNNIIVKLNNNKSLSGLYPAYKKISRWDGANDKWDVYFVAAKQYHSLVDDNTIANISYDKMMGKLKESYFDYANRELRIFAIENDAINYLNK